MIHSIMRAMRYRFASGKVEEFTGLPLRNTKRGATLRKYFYALSKPRAFSKQASVAMLLLIYAIVICEEVYADAERDEYAADTTMRFGLVPSLKPLILVWEELAKDRDSWSAHIGDRLKTEFNARWRMLEKQTDDRMEQRQRSKSATES